MADPHQVSLHISAPLTDLAWRSGLQNNLILVSLCSSSNELSAVVAISHVHDGQSIGFYSDLPHIMDGGGRDPFKNHASEMYKQEICVLTTVFMNVPMSWTYFMQARKTNI